MLPPCGRDCWNSAVRSVCFRGDGSSQGHKAPETDGGDKRLDQQRLTQLDFTSLTRSAFFFLFFLKNLDTIFCLPCDQAGQQSLDQFDLQRDSKTAALLSVISRLWPRHPVESALDQEVTFDLSLVGQN